jgi:hypothetical protein
LFQRDPEKWNFSRRVTFRSPAPLPAFGEFMSDRNARSAPEQETRPVVSPTKARQGTKGHNVRYVLWVGTIGAVIALALAYFAFFAS